MTNHKAGLYIHVPFCAKKCAYCDFYSLSGRADVMDLYLSALVREIDGYRRQERIEIDTVYFGGGTPSLLGAGRLAAILDAVVEVFSLSTDSEITTEINPVTDSLSLQRDLKAAGFNRISVGVQSTSDAELSALGRPHTAAEALDALAHIRAAGFENFSADLMYAIPGQSTASFQKTLSDVLSFDPPHLSVYGLIVEPGTPFFDRRDALSFPGDDAERDLYDLCCSTLEQAGYEHYEISNYARPGRRCRHNLKYWRLSPYIGCGPAAHSFFDGVRYANRADLDAYLTAPLSLRYTEERPTPRDLAEEYAMLGLRLKEGISLSRFRRMSGHDFAYTAKEAERRCISAGYMTEVGDRLALTEEGFYVSNAILAELSGD